MPDDESRTRPEEKDTDGTVAIMISDDQSVRNA
jgi:hypothetical protein